MNEADEKVIEQMRRAIEDYAGPVTRCPPGKARAPAKEPLVKNKAVEFLMQNHSIRPIRNPKDRRRQIQMVRSQQQRIAKHNAPLLKRINKQERSAERNAGVLAQTTARGQRGQQKK